MSQKQDLSAFGIEDRSYTIEEWQAIEEKTGEKFEYHEGRLVHRQAMAGGTFGHSLISGNVMYVLGGGVREREKHAESSIHCGVHTGDLLIKIKSTDSYLYPDAAVVCGKPQYDTRVKSAISNPLIVVEVLSPSSASYDHNEKFEYYGELDSIREYVLVSQDKPYVQVRSRREAGGPWFITFVKTLDAAVMLPGLGLELAMAEIYRGVEFGGS